MSEEQKTATEQRAVARDDFASAEEFEEMCEALGIELEAEHWNVLYDMEFGSLKNGVGTVGWHATPTKNGTAFDIGAADGANIALVHGPGNGGEAEFEDHARLIAAAPDLLAALRELRGWMPPSGDDRINAALAVADAALAKAEGRS